MLLGFGYLGSFDLCDEVSIVGFVFCFGEDCLEADRVEKRLGMMREGRVRNGEV